MATDGLGEVIEDVDGLILPPPEGVVEPGKPVVKKVGGIKPPSYALATFPLVGTAIYVQHAFPPSQFDAMKKKQQEGSTQASKRRTKAPRDFKRAYEEAMHRDAREGWWGIPATAFRKAMIDGCRFVGFAMTNAKGTLFVQADGYEENGTGLVKLLTPGTNDAIYAPTMHEMIGRNETGVADIRIRPMWPEWSVSLRVRFNTEFFTEIDIANLLAHTGISIGVGEGRPYSKKSAGLDWGTFAMVGEDGRPILYGVA